MIFLRTNLPNFVQFKQYYGKILSMTKGLGEAKTPNSTGNYAMFSMNSRSFVSVSLTSSLESTPSFSTSTSHQSPIFQLTCSYDWHFIFHRFTTLIITSSLFHSRLKTFLFHKSFPPYSSLLPLFLLQDTPRTPRTVYRYFGAYPFLSLDAMHLRC